VGVARVLLDLVDHAERRARVALLGGEHQGEPLARQPLDEQVGVGTSTTPRA
jgi:hypothetical protein